MHPALSVTGGRESNIVRVRHIAQLSTQDLGARRELLCRHRLMGTIRDLEVDELDRLPPTVIVQAPLDDRVEGVVPHAAHQRPHVGPGVQYPLTELATRGGRLVGSAARSTGTATRIAVRVGHLLENLYNIRTACGNDIREDSGSNRRRNTIADRSGYSGYAEVTRKSLINRTVTL